MRLYLFKQARERRFWERILGRVDWNKYLAERSPNKRFVVGASFDNLPLEKIYEQEMGRPWIPLAEDHPFVRQLQAPGFSGKNREKREQLAMEFAGHV